MRHLLLAILSALLLTSCTSPQGEGTTEVRTYEARQGSWTFRVALADSLTLTIIDSVDSPPSRQVVSCSYRAEGGTMSVPECPHAVASRTALADSLVAHISHSPGSDSARMMAERVVHPFLEGARVQDSTITSTVEDGAASRALTFRRVR